MNSVPKLFRTLLKQPSPRRERVIKTLPGGRVLVLFHNYLSIGFWNRNREAE